MMSQVWDPKMRETGNWRAIVKALSFTRGDEPFFRPDDFGASNLGALQTDSNNRTPPYTIGRRFGEKEQKKKNFFFTPGHVLFRPFLVVINTGCVNTFLFLNWIFGPNNCLPFEERRLQSDPRFALLNKVYILPEGASNRNRPPNLFREIIVFSGTIGKFLTCKFNLRCNARWHMLTTLQGRTMSNDWQRKKKALKYDSMFRATGP